MITRVWRGWTSPENANAYQDLLLSELFPTLRSLPEFLGADVLRRDDGEHVAFMTLTRIASLEDVRGFATGDLDVRVIEPRAAELLARYEPRVEHFTTERFER